MAVKKLRPVTAGTRHRIAPVYSGLSKVEPEKSLLTPLRKKGGRNNSGRMTMRYIGGGHKQNIRIIDFKRNKHNIPATVATLEYDPTRTAFVALLHYADGEKRYIIAPNGLKVGDSIVSGTEVAPELGNAMPLSALPLGTIVHNIEIRPGAGAAMVRSAGAYAQLLARDGKYSTIKLPSGEMRLVLSASLATVGVVSNSDHMLIRKGKAGRNRWMGKRPRVRGVVMNPVDHPMGGGEGKSSGGHPRSRKGLLSKGLKTRTPKKYSNNLIIGKKK